MAYVAINGYVFPADLSTGAVGKVINADPGGGASAIAIAPDGQTAYVAINGYVFPANL